MNNLYFILTCLLHFFLWLAGIFSFDYIETGSKDVALMKNLVWLIIIALVMGVAYFIFFKKAFPRGYQVQNNFGKVAIPILFCVVSFFLNRGVLFLVNSFYNKGKMIIAGQVTKKYYERGSKGGKTYYMIVSGDNNVEYKFVTSKKVYNQSAGPHELFDKEFFIGWFGIIYSK